MLQAPLDATHESQELMQLVINHLRAAQAMSTYCPSTDTTTLAPGAGGLPPPKGPGFHAGPMMLRPVAMRGCLHMLLPVCLAQTSCVFDRPITEILQQLSSTIAHEDQDTSAAQRSTQLYIQVDQGEPQLVVKQPDGAWALGDDSKADTAAAASPSISTHPATDGSSAPNSKEGSSSGIGCWLVPPVLLLRPASGRTSAGPLSPPTSSSTGRHTVKIRGLPASAGTLVRVLLVQGASVVADQLLPATVEERQGEVVSAAMRTVRYV